MTNEGWPQWAREALRLSEFKRILVLHGNVRDLVHCPGPDGQPWSTSLRQALFDLFEERFEIVAAYDMVDGMALPSLDNRWKERVPKMEQQLEAVLRAGSPTTRGGLPGPIQPTGSAVEVAVAQIGRCLRSGVPSVIVVEDTAQIASHPAPADQAERMSFLRLLRAATASDPGARSLLVLVSQNAASLPPWLLLNNPLAASLEIPTPSALDRSRFLGPLAHTMGLGSPLEDLVARTDGMSLWELGKIKRDVFENSKRVAEGLGQPQKAKEFVDALRFGTRESDWDRPELGRRLADAEAFLGKRVLGQVEAVRSAADVLRRAALGLSGAQHSCHGKPRGILFFAGFTGVGKTELAKAMAELVFGDERAMKRFDMSEYGHSHADQRLLGAPPGYVGYEEGGQLTEAMKSNPFRLLLFDEVEKAHPSILDKFLQILEDGRMTDGRGETVHFSEALIVFTSNAGIYTIDYETGRPLVDPKTLKPLLRVDPRTQPTYDEVRTRLTEGVREHFQHLVQRPELLNRIGRNIVVFDIVRPEVMRLILEKVLGAVRELARTRWGVALDLAPALVDRLHALASQDVESGGRGVGNLVEAAVLNPLSRLLFRVDGGVEGLRGRTLRLTSLDEKEGYDLGYEVV